MTPEVVAVVLIAVVHLVGAGMLVWLLVAQDDADWRSWWPDDGPGGGGPKRPDGPAGPPLPDADQSPRRLRGPDRLSVTPRRRRAARGAEARPRERRVRL